ncbi:MAG: 3-deoxy-7-phosphoheptulonate synthase [Deltaproteobacteria bacterium]|nr:3-deoxy-7-phosphoheptulonate synthase [Deltaproteobacteria bacterium]
MSERKLIVLRDRADAQRVIGALGVGVEVSTHLDAHPPILFVRSAGVVDRASPGIVAVLDEPPEYPLSSRELVPGRTVVDVSGVSIGGDAIVVVAGPCSVESLEQLVTIAAAVRAAGAVMVRGGAFKPRTSPYTFQGLGLEGLRLLREVRSSTGMPVVTEVMSVEDIELVSGSVDCLQVGARSMQNFALLKALGKVDKPVLLKRGFGCTVRELLGSAEHILSAGNPSVILCERGIRTFESSMRFTFDLGAIALLKQLTHLPVLADPSHAAGDPRLVPALARGAIAAGADGLLLEVHAEPAAALSDGEQALTPGAFRALMDGLAPVAAAVGRKLLTLG